MIRNRSSFPSPTNSFEMLDNNKTASPEIRRGGRRIGILAGILLFGSAFYIFIYYNNRYIFDTWAYTRNQKVFTGIALSEDFFLRY